jgi:hypothetical protein
MKKLSIAMIGATFTALGVTATAQAATITAGLNGAWEAGNNTLRAAATTITVGGPWNEFSFTTAGVPARGCSPADPSGLGCEPSSALNSVFVGPPAWEFVVPAAGVNLKVTDAFLNGDVFDIFDFGVLIGSTSAVGTGGACGSDPEVCFADPLISSGIFALAAGSHSLTITPSASPFGAGAAYFRVDEAKPVPESASTVSILAFGALGAGSMLKRKQQQKA